MAWSLPCRPSRSNVAGNPALATGNYFNRAQGLVMAIASFIPSVRKKCTVRSGDNVLYCLPPGFGTNLQLRARRHLFTTCLNLIHHPPGGVRLAFSPFNVAIEILRNALICFVHYGAMPHIARCTSIKNSQPKSKSHRIHMPVICSAAVPQGAGKDQR